MCFNQYLKCQPFISNVPIISLLCYTLFISFAITQATLKEFSPSFSSSLSQGKVNTLLCLQPFSVYSPRSHWQLARLVQCLYPEGHRALDCCETIGNTTTVHTVIKYVIQIKMRQLKIIISRRERKKIQFQQPQKKYTH